MKSLSLGIAALLLSFYSFAQIASISGPSSICNGNCVTYTDATSGGIWSSSTPAIAAVGSLSGIVCGVSSGTFTLSYTVGTSSVTYLVTNNPTPAVISGIANLCVGATTTLYDATGGGTWSSNNVTIASVGSGSGIVSGIAAGTATITYTLPGGCYKTQAVIVNATPSGIIGSSTVCLGMTTGLFDAAGGGVWTSSNTIIASVGSSGVVSGISLGVANISYTLSTGCFAVMPVTVSANPASITGPNVLCDGTTITLSDATSGGAWSSSNTSLATVAYATGIVTGVSSGVAYLSYTLPSGCFASYPVTIDADPPFISGSGTVCIGTSILLSDGASGGVWSSGSGAIATVGTSSGVVTGVSSGTANITYTLSTGCYTVTQVSANSTPLLISGLSPLCLGGTATYTTPTLYGVWSSTSSGVATIGSTTGVATGVSAGSTTISYIPPGGTCSSAFALTVSSAASPALYTVTGGGGYCSGGSGVAIGLSGSQSGQTYTLIMGGYAVTSVTGTGGAISFGTFNSPGTYTVYAANSTLCGTYMHGSASVSINPLPTVFTVTGGSTCAGGSVTAGLSGSTSGVNYQLMNGSTMVGLAVPGTGAALSFGAQTATGTYTVIATDASTGCTKTMNSSAAILTTATTTLYTVSGGGSYCAGGTGVGIWLSGSIPGASYQLYDGSTAVSPPVTGTGVPLGFGVYTAVGTYTVSCNAGTSCAAGMSGSVTVSVNPLPTVFNVSGGTACSGGSGVTIGLSGSVTGTSYDLYYGSTLIYIISGTGSPLTFSTFTGVGTYVVTATISSTGCTANMSGSASVISSATVYTVTGGGSYCSGGTGVAVGLSNSQSGVSYQLYNGGSAVGSAVSGTGSALSFGLQTAAGTYTIVANPGTSCAATMSGSAVITINPLPTAFTVSGGGSTCGGSGVAIGLSGSQSGINYELFRGSTPVTSISGGGGTLSFGLFTTAGTYTVVAVNPGTGCTNAMSGSAIISSSSGVSPIVPGSTTICVGSTTTASDATGGGVWSISPTSVATINSSAIVTGVSAGTATISYAIPSSGCYVTATLTVLATPVSITGPSSICTGSSGTLADATSGGVWISSSTAIAMVGSASGIVSGVAAGVVNITYILSSGCYAVTAETVVASPAAISGSSSICAGTAATYTDAVGGGIWSSSNTSIVTIGSSTGVANSVATGAATISYSVGTSCFATKAVSVLPVPAVYTVSGGGSFCPGGAGVAVGLSNSQTGISYQLYNGGVAVGSAVSGTGAAISFGLQTGAGTYTVVANPGTTCSTTMSGSATIIVNPTPIIYTVTGGGVYCPGGAAVHIGLSNSQTGVSYQLYRGGVATGSPVAGTGAGITFGTFTTAGTYTVVANPGLSCPATMSGSATVSGGSGALPAIVAVGGGGSFCAGGTGVAVTLPGSSVGFNYQLYVSGVPTGSPLAGAGTGLNFGPQTVPGSYTVVAFNAITGCASNMTGSATVTEYPAPAVYTVSGGGSYCAGGTGVAVGLSGSVSGINYTLYKGGVLVTGSSRAGTGAAISFGLQTAAGTYTAVATNATTFCTSNMSGTAVITINSVTAYSVTGTGGVCSSGPGRAVGLSSSDAGVTYQLYRGTTLAGSPVPGTGSAINFGTETVTGSYTVVGTNTTTGCSGTMAGSAVLTLLSSPYVFTVSGGGSYCPGGSGVIVGLSSSVSGTSYQLYRGSTAVGGPVAGTGTTLSFGLQTIAGTYTVVATIVSTGCTGNMSGGATVVVNPTPTISGSIYTLMPGANITLTSGVSGGTWSSSNIAIASVGASTGVVHGVALGSANITYTLPTGCYAVHGVSVTVSGFREAPGSTTEIFSDIKVTPNPSKGIFTIKGSTGSTADEEVEIIVTDILGQVVYSSKASAQSGVINETVQLNSMTANGMYLLAVRSGTENKVFHIVVER